MSTKERSVRFSTKKPIEHESFDYNDDVNTYFSSIINLPLPDIHDDVAYNKLDIFTAASLGPEYLQTDGSIDWNGRNLAGWTALMYAAYLGHVSVSNFLYAKGISLDTTNEQKQTALMLAASCGSREMVVFLLEHRVDVNKRDPIGQTSLHYATRYNQSTITELLVKAGADPNLPDDEGMTPTLIACKIGDDATVSCLIKYKGNPNIVNKSGENGVMLAADHPKVLKVLQNRMTMYDVLRQLGLEKYNYIFERDEISLNLFLKLTEQDLEDMGINLFGPKKKLMNVIKHYQQHGIISTDPDVLLPSTHLQPPPGSPKPSKSEQGYVRKPSKEVVPVPIDDIHEQISLNDTLQHVLSFIGDKDSEIRWTPLQYKKLALQLETATNKFKLLIAENQ